MNQITEVQKERKKRFLKILGLSIVGVPLLAKSAFADLFFRSPDGTLTNLSAGSTSNRVEIEAAFKAAFATKYSELAYTGDDLVTITIWDTDSKVTKLFTKTFTYSGGLLTVLATVDELTSKTLTKNFTYNGSDVLTEIREVYA